MSNRKPFAFLELTAARLNAMQAKVANLDTKLVEQDIAARRIEADVGWEYAQQVDKIVAALKSSGQRLNIEQWCKKALGVDAVTMGRRKRLYRHWNIYAVERRRAGQCGQSGLMFALALIKDTMPPPERNFKPSQVPFRPGTIRPRPVSVVENIHGCQLITGDALTELPKLAASSVNAVMTSPPYFGAKRTYAGIGIGFEDTVTEYVAAVVAVFRETRRVLRDDGTLWVVIDDTYEHGDLMFIPARLAMAMQADGWVCRAEIIWRKLGGGRPDPVSNRPVKDYEHVLMLTKMKTGYFYDADPHRIPLVKPHSTLGRQKAGLNRQDTNRTQTVFGNPLGRLGGSVWEISPASNYRGAHPATMPAELVRRCLEVSCPEGGTVLDPFGGAGTVALVATQMDFQAISIEISEEYTREARQRLLTAIGDDTPSLIAAE